MSASAESFAIVVPCPACGHEGLEGFYRQEAVPSHSCLQFDTRLEAVEFPTGRLELGFCPACAFVCNAAVDEELQAYSAAYEETQGFSPRFRQFADGLAADLVRRHDLHDRDILEIGCGKGDFLAEVCRLGPNRGVGIDPAVAPERIAPEVGARIEWIADYWSERHAALRGDVVLCRHTLEHVPRPRAFLALLRRTLADRHDTLVFFELPDVRRVLEEVAFWDFYYEHCSYYTAGSLARQFRTCGFRVTRIEVAYDGQYLLLDARPAPADEPPAQPLPSEDGVADVRASVGRFRRGFAQQQERWRGELAAASGEGGAVVWGSGSKGVSFLTTLGVGAEVDRVVDINPHRQGRFMAGTGHPIVAPEALRESPPALVVAMNPIYLAEIGARLSELGVEARLVAV